MDADEGALLLAVLNTTPVVRGVVQDQLQAPGWPRWLSQHFGVASLEERDALMKARDLLQHAVREHPDLPALADVVRDVTASVDVERGRLIWTRRLPTGRALAARVVLAWAELDQDRPGRLRACANPACRRFLLDRSHADRARWCSMATCGNRAKARRHYERVRGAADPRQAASTEG